MLYYMSILLLSSLFILELGLAFKEDLCNEISKVFESQCEGIIIKGSAARQDSAVKADFETISEDLEQRVHQMEMKIERMQEEFQALMKKIESENNDQIALRKISCPVKYDEKCYRAILHDEQDVDFKRASDMCHQIGWKLANVYSIEHFELLKKYLFNLIEPTNFVSAWIGMKWDYNKRFVYLSNDAIAVDLPTLSGYPVSDAETMNIYVSNVTDPGSSGIMNYDRYFMRRGALCEV